MQEKSRMRLTKPGLIGLILSTMLLASCATQKSSETERSICRELARDLPSYSLKDTPETLIEGARFMRVFEAVCGVR